MIVIVRFGLSHNLLLTTVFGLIIKHQVGDSIIVWSSELCLYWEKSFIAHLGSFNLTRVRVLYWLTIFILKEGNFIKFCIWIFIDKLWVGIVYASIT